MLTPVTAAWETAQPKMLRSRSRVKAHATVPLDVGLVDEPAVPGGMPQRAGGVGEQPAEPLHPPVHRHVIHRYAALGQQLLHPGTTARTGDTSEIPADRDRDHLRREPKPGERRSTQGRADRGRRTRPASSAGTDRHHAGPADATDPARAPMSRWAVTLRGHGRGQGKTS